MEKKKGSDDESSNEELDLLEQAIIKNINETTKKSFLLDKKKLVSGLFIVFGIAISWVFSTQFSQSVVIESGAVYFLIWFSTNFNLFCFIIYCIIFYTARGSHDPRLSYPWDCLLFEEHPISFKKLFLGAFFFYLLWAGANYSYVKALESSTVTLVTSIFSVNPALVFILSLVILKEEWRFLKFVAVLFAFAGLLCVNLSTISFDGHWIGNLLAVISTICAATYKVLFKYIFGDASFGTVSIFLGCLGLINFVIFWIIPLSLDLSGKEVVNSQDLLWGFLIISCILSLIFNFFVNFGIAYTYPLFISIGIILGIPISAIIDVTWRETKFGYLEILGFVFIIIGFCLLLYPYSIRETIEKLRKK